MIKIYVQSEQVRVLITDKGILRGNCPLHVRFYDFHTDANAYNLVVVVYAYQTY